MPTRSRSSTNLKTNEANSQSLTLDMLAKLRQDIKKDMTSGLKSEILAVRRDLTGEISALKHGMNDHERRLDLVPDLIDAKIVEAKEPIDWVIKEMSKNLAEVDGKTASLSSDMAQIQAQVAELTDKLANAGNLSDPDAMARLESVER